MNAVAPASVALRAHVFRLRRRATLVLFARCYAATLSAAFLIAAAALLLKLSSPVLLASAAGAAAAAAGLVTVARVPSPRAIAATVDRRLQLGDLTVTAYQCAESRDAFSQLVVRDAVAQLDRVTPSEAFPLQLSAFALAMPLIVGVVMLASLGLPSFRGIGFAGSISASAPGGAASRTAAQGDSTRRSEAQPSRLADNSSPRAGTPSPVSARATPSEQRAPSPALAAPRADGGIGAPVQSGGAVAAPTGDARGDTTFKARGAASSSDSPRGGSRLAGGATGEGAASRGRGSRNTSPADGRAYAAAYRAGRAAAETAVVQDRIPPQRRAYVRAYFQAIRPMDGQ